MPDFLPALLITPLVVLFVAFQCLVVRLRGDEDGFLLAQIRASLWLYAKVFFRLQVSNCRGDPIPPQGAFVVVANHQSAADPVLLSLLTRRRIRFLMAREYYELRLLRWFFRLLGCIPVNRDGRDLSATKAALGALADGHSIGIFPQGGIREAGEHLEDAKAGVALLVLKTATPVIPFYVDGTRHSGAVLSAFFLPGKVSVFCGRPIHFRAPMKHKPSKAELQEVMQEVLRSIAALRPGETRVRP